MERQRKRELRDLNAKAWAGETDVFPVQGSLDSSMKKNTAFIKRLRTAITASSKDTFIQEIRSLTLHKYLSELISACFEGLCKLKTPTEISTGVEVVSALHQRFGPAEFTEKIGWLIGRGLSSPDKALLKTLAQDVREREERERISRQRVLLRVATELWLVGVLRSLEDTARPDEAGTKGKENAKATDLISKSKSTASGARSDAEAEPFPLEALKDMLGHDREHANLPLVVIFVKAFAWDVLGVNFVTAEGRKTVAEDGSTTLTNSKTDDTTTTDEDEGLITDPPLTSSPELRQRFRNVFNRYFDDVKLHIARDQKSMITQSRRNAEAYVKSGEVFEDRQANYEKQVKAQERLITNAQILADALGVEMPSLQDKDSTANSGDGSIGLVKAGEYLRGSSDGPGIWEDEEERRFYENLIDLKDRVPGILLEDVKKKKPEGEDQVGKRVDGAAVPIPSDSKQEPDSAVEKSGDAEDQSIAIANKSVGAQVDALLSRLPEFTTKDSVDQTAMDFCFLNSKASRNRLIKAVEELPKGRTDLLPLYARLVATLGKYMPDIPHSLVSYLDDEFRSLQRRKSKDFLGQVRTQNVRYLAELTKFGIVPVHVIFHCLKVSLDEFSRMNIEIICNLLENCGRYLLRNPETRPQMQAFIATLERKKGAQHLGQQERMLIENAVYYVAPPERAAIEQKERTPLELFLRKLMYTDLSRRTLDKIVRQIRKLHWEEPDVVRTLEKIFSKPHRIKYSNIHLLAVILGSLNRYHQEFTIGVIDDVLEQIVLGLETNDFKYNQRRLAEVKYLGELYIYRMVDSPVIFDTMYKIISYGYENGTPRPGSVNSLDYSDDFFRTRLVCSLLETCGVYYDKGQAKKKLDFFLTFFQYYIQTKDPMPVELDYIVEDVYRLLRPTWKLLITLEEASNAFADAVKQNYQAISTDRQVEIDEPEDSSSEDGDDEEIALPEVEGDKSSGEDAEASQDEEAPNQDSSSDEEMEKIVVTRQENERDPELDAEFDRELNKLLSESLDSRKFERKPVFDVPLPMRRAREAALAAADDSGGETPAPVPQPIGGMMKFSLLSKKGNRQQTRSIDLPSNSNFAVAMRTQQQAEKEEQQRIKNLVLNYDLRDENEPDVIEKQHHPYAQVRVDKAGTGRSTQRARKLQLSDVDWT